MKSNWLILLLVLGLSLPALAQKGTKIYIVRHAEKDNSNPNNPDPLLSLDGQKRAMDLLKYLKGEKIDTIYSTNFKRTKLTAQPLADRMGINIKTYSPSLQNQLVSYILKHGDDKKYLIVGHSNTVQEIIVAFGLEKPVKDLTESDYDYIFTLNIKGDKKDVKVSRYGQSNHSDANMENSKNGDSKADASKATEPKKSDSKAADLKPN